MIFSYENKKDFFQNLIKTRNLLPLSEFGFTANFKNYAGCMNTYWYWLLNFKISLDNLWTFSKNCCFPLSFHIHFLFSFWKIRSFRGSDTNSLKYILFNCPIFLPNFYQKFVKFCKIFLKNCKIFVGCWNFLKFEIFESWGNLLREATHPNPSAVSPL